MTGHTYRTAIAEHPIPEILQTLADYQVPGEMRCTNGGQIRLVRFSGGRILSAVSEAPPANLIDFLLGRGRINEEQFAKARQWVAEGQGGEGAVLVAIGALSPTGLDAAIQEMAAATVIELSDWPQGSAEVTLGKPGEAPPQSGLPIQSLILQGIRAMSDAKRAVAGVGGRETVLEPAEGAFQRLGELEFTREEMRLVRMMDGQRTFFELVQAGVSAGMTQAAAAKAIYAMVVLRLAQKKAGLRMKV